jgi:hypothetical protein
VQLIDQAGALPDDGLQTQSDVAEALAFGRQARHGPGPFADGEAGAGAGLDRIGLLRAVDAQAIVLVALRVAAGEGELGALDVQLVQPGEQVVGVGAGDVEADEEADAAVLGELVDQIAEALPQLGVALRRLDDFEFGRGALELVVQERGVVAVACGVDADADGGARRTRRAPHVSGRSLVASGCGLC